MDLFAARILPLSARFNGKVRAVNEFYPRKMNIIIIITHFCKFTST